MKAGSVSSLASLGRAKLALGDRLAAKDLSLVSFGESAMQVLRVSLDQPPRLLGQLRLDGSAANRPALVKAARAKGFLRGRVNLLLGVRERSVAMLPRPPVDDAELLDAVRWQLQDAFSFPPESAVLDVLTIDDAAPRERQQVMVFAIQRESLAELLKPFGAAGVRPRVVDAVDCAQRNLVRACCGDERTVACLAYSGAALLFTVSRGEDLFFSRVFDNLGGEGDAGDVVERVGLQIQRSSDLLERRDAGLAPAELVIGPPTAADDGGGSDQDLLVRCAELTGLRWRRLDWRAALGGDLPGEGIPEDELFHLYGAALRGLE